MPAADDERYGVEDARFVRFVADDGTVEYRGTFTAFDGHNVASKLLSTTDFAAFTVHRLTGAAARTKGMALFPARSAGTCSPSRGREASRSPSHARRMASPGRYEVRLATSDLLWEVVQTGNCGSPIETDQGWLVLTHGVGPMRRYSIGAILLDLEDPTW